MFARVFQSLPNCVSQKLTAIYFKTKALRVVGYHSEPITDDLVTMRVRILPALQDNYMYLLIDPATNDAAVIDPVEPATVLAAIKEEGVSLTTILTTHHHWDHAGGNVDLVKNMPTLSVYGGDSRIGALTHEVKHADSFSVGDLTVSCLATPCHTTGHICYYITPKDDSETGIVFTGDTLFLGGCGRFFEGTPEEMYSALVDKLGSLPDMTQVYCGHEYSLQNLKFALHVEPDNKYITDKIAWATKRRAEKLPTVPSTIGEEKRINPFMRVREKTVQEFAGCSEPIPTMAYIRTQKDSYK